MITLSTYEFLHIAGTPGGLSRCAIRRAAIDMLEIAGKEEEKEELAKLKELPGDGCSLCLYEDWLAAQRST